MAKWLAQGNPMEQEYKIAHGGSGGLQGPGTVPYSFVIGRDGKVVWQGGGAAPGKAIEEAMAVKSRVTKEEAAKAVEDRASRMITHAESLKSQSRYMEALEVLGSLKKDRTLAKTDAVKKADELKDAIEKTEDETAKTELDLQKKVGAIVGGERPKENFKGKLLPVNVKRLEALQKEAEEKSAPVAAELAKFWIAAMTK